MQRPTKPDRELGVIENNLHKNSIDVEVATSLKKLDEKIEELATATKDSYKINEPLIMALLSFRNVITTIAISSSMDNTKKEVCEIIDDTLLILGDKTQPLSDELKLLHLKAYSEKYKQLRKDADEIVTTGILFAPMFVLSDVILNRGKNTAETFRYIKNYSIFNQSLASEMKSVKKVLKGQIKAKI